MPSSEMGKVFSLFWRNPGTKMPPDPSSRQWEFPKTDNREAYKADNYDFDNPIKLYTLHRDYAPAAIEHYGRAYMSAVEVSKRYGDMRLDDPMLPLLDEALYEVYVQIRTVTFKSLTPENDSYRVNYGDGCMVSSIEILK